MKTILDICHEFNFGETYAYTDKVRKAIFEQPYGADPVEVATDIENQISRPQKWTLLHDYIGHVIEEDIHFHFSGPGWDYYAVEPVVEILDSLQIPYTSLEEFVTDFYADDDEVCEITEELLEKHQVNYALDYLEPHATEALKSLFVKEVFTILFSDREAMKVFNIRIAEYLGEKTPRCTYWPRWLQRALFCREKGLCAICKCDLSSYFHTAGRLAIDHIVPIALNGINDPTNLQILCESCNGKKSGNEIVTSSASPLYW
jgi:hypothetical protein